MTLEKIVGKLSDEQLKQCFDDIIEWRQTGVLKLDSIIRECWEEFKQTSSSFPIHMMSEPILFEIARRHYE